MPDCNAKAHGEYRDVRMHPCSRKGTVERDGRWYCWQHDPVRVAEEEEKRRAIWAARAIKRDEYYRRKAAVYKACEGVSTEVLETISVADLLRKADEAEKETDK